MVPNYDPNDYIDSPLLEVREELNEGEMTKEEREALGEQVDYDGSRLTAEQRRAVFKSYWPTHLKFLGLRSPQYYGDKSQCLSVSETAWPGITSFLEADRLKRGYIEPKDLIERLRKLKPSDNFELRKFRHPRMSWKSPTPLQEEGFEIFPPDPEWLMNQLYKAYDMEGYLGRRSAARYHQQIRKSADQYRQEIKDRWDQIELSVELMPLPDLHLLRDMGHSPGGTLFPWNLVKGLMALRDHANEMGGKSYDEEYDNAIARRKEAIHHWKERNPESILADDPLSIYTTWPAELMDELDEIDREAIRRGRRKYVALLRDAEKKMLTLVAFWSDCGLVTGHRTQPSSWWQDPKTRVEQLPKPQCLQERLDTINTKFGYHSEEAEKLRKIETLSWIESLIARDCEPTASDTPLPQSLLDELDIVWQDRHLLDYDDMEDEMIARIRRWRKSKHQHRPEEGLRMSLQPESDIGPKEPAQMAGSPACSSQKNLLRDSASGVVTTSEEALQLRDKLARGARRRSKAKTTMTEDRAIWQGRLRSRPNSMIPGGHVAWQNRLRPRCGAVGPSPERLHSIQSPTGKPKGIVKEYVRKRQGHKPQIAMKSQATTSIARRAGASHVSNANSQFNEASLRSTPARSVRVRETKNARRLATYQTSAVRQGAVQKIHNTRGRQTRKLMATLNNKS